MPSMTRDEFVAVVHAANAGGNGPGAPALAGASRHANPTTMLIPVAVSLMDDLLTPVLAYRRLVAPDERTAPSFLFESVEGGERLGRHSILSARPRIEVIARQGEVTVRRDMSEDPESLVSVMETTCDAQDPLELIREFSATMRVVKPPAKKGVNEGEYVLGGWFGYAGYDSVRYVEPEKLQWTSAPPDDRRLPDVHFAYYDSVVTFDHVKKTVHVTKLVEIKEGEEGKAGELYDRAVAWLEERVRQLQSPSRTLTWGRLDEQHVRTGTPPTPVPRQPRELTSNMTEARHAEMVAKAKEYIVAGDIFQVVVGQRFERVSTADPFDVYRALRTVNPSPYMVYLQAEGCMLVASSPEILCRVKREAAKDGAEEAVVVTNRPLAGTRKRGSTPEEDAALERELLADPKERAEHIMLVDLGRNDVGRVARAGTIGLPSVMAVERYSHVMHISSTVTGELREGMTCWDALRAALPVGTISGAPKIRAMQIIDELEPVRRGPYGGGMGYVSLDGEMDIALALRTIVVPVGMRRHGTGGKDEWVYHLQAAGGIVADSVARDEYLETVNKSAALARAIDVAETAFDGAESGA